ncbi:TPA: hypothetical protein JG871_003923 [Enterobacter hormaechei subsp. xiangfangensis]|nr:hypothetical protein [Enterobacter hormaechei subsp. xiangfangensis]
MRDQAISALEVAEQHLNRLVNSYTEEKDGKFSACHPRCGIESTTRQLAKLRKALLGTRV